MTARELGAEYIEIGRALQKIPSASARVGDHRPKLDGQTAVGVAAFLCYFRDLLTATPTETFSRGELLAMLETMSRDEEMLPAGIGVRLWDVEHADEGGLMSDKLSPLIGDIPVLGKLFQSKSVSRQNTEPIVIAAPEMARPIPAGQPVPELNFPKPFPEPNTGKDPRTPGRNVTCLAPVKPPNEAIPLEKLMQSPQPVTLPVQRSLPPAAAPANSPAAPPR